MQSAKERKKIFKKKSIQTIKFYQSKSTCDTWRLHGSTATITKYCACAQLFWCATPGGVRQLDNNRNSIWRHWRGTWETWVHRWLQGRSGGIWPHKSGATLTPNAKILQKCQFHGVFLKVSSPLTVIYRELPRHRIAFHPGGAIQYRQDPTDKSVWGIKQIGEIGEMEKWEK